MRLVRGVIVRRGQLDEVLADGPLRQGVQTEIGRRNAMARTQEGLSFHIHDDQWRLPIAGHPMPKLLVPQLRTVRHRHIGKFPVKGDVIYAMVPNKRGPHGRHPEAVAWCGQKSYVQSMQRIVSGHSSFRYQPQVVELLIELQLNALSMTPDEIFGMTEQLVSLGCDYRYLMACIQHYVLGVSAEQVNTFNIDGLFYRPVAPS